jgi:hypothetical protein
MSKDYIAPRDVDAEWADVLVLSAPPDRTEEMEQYLDSARDAIRGRTGVVLGTFAEKAAAAGVIVARPAGDAGDSAAATAYARRTVEAVRAAKAGAAGAPTPAGD